MARTNTRNDQGEDPRLPPRPIQALTRPFVRFLRVESASGVILLACTVLALALANGPTGDWWRALWDTPLSVGFPTARLSQPLWFWINDALMTVFFFVIGLEIKRELISGELADRRKVILPVAAAAGGALVPALLYAGLHVGEATLRGWAVPMATDIAFVVGCLALLGPRVPHELKIFLLSLAIVDDLFAVLVIAVFYTSSIHVGALVVAAGGFALVAGLNRAGVRTLPAYVIVGTGTWLAMHESGVHATVAGVLLGLMTPASAWIGEGSFLEFLDRTQRALRGRTATTDGAERRETLDRLAFAATEATSPLERLERSLHPWVGFVIMPLFALANAGVVVSLGSALDRVAVGVGVGLVVGKPLGILLASFIVVRLGWTTLPAGVNWKVMTGAGCLAGIGFTMAIFIASLGLTGAALTAAKTGVLMGSGLSLVLGLSLLATFLPPREA